MNLVTESVREKKRRGKRTEERMAWQMSRWCVTSRRRGSGQLQRAAAAAAATDQRSMQPVCCIG